MIGQSLGHYKIVGKLGAGGMGEVYRAQDTTLDREVALKILPREVASDPDRLARFQREAKTLAALDHPHIVTIYSVEESEGIRFLTMQLVKGKELSAHIPAGGMVLERIFEIAIPLADALRVAHEKGIVHRDLKPGNVMVTADRRVKVLDFGLAKLRGEAAPADETALPTEPLTQEGLVLGTVPYMSPEQLEGQPVDARSDIFALGVILYEMATGQRPFTGTNSMSIVGSILRDTPEDIDALRPELPHHLGRIVRHCLEKEPTKRFQSALDVRNELGDLHQELTSGAAQPSVFVPEPSAPASSRASRPWVIALGLALLVMVGWWLIRGRSPPPLTTQDAESQRIVVLPFENLGPAEDEYFADGMTEEITSRLASVPALQVISRTTAMQYKDRRPALSEIGDELGVAYALEGTVRWAKTADGVSRVRITPQLIRVADDTHLWSQSYDRVLDDIFLVQSELAKHVLEKLDITLSGSQQASVEAQPTENLDAYQAYLRGRYLDSQPHFALDNWMKALASYERAVELDPGFALAWGQLSRAHARLVYFLVDASDERRDSARQAADRAAELAPDTPEAHLAHGYYFLLAERDAASAERHFEIAARVLPDSAEVLQARGEVARLQGLMEEALHRYQKAVELSPLESSPVTETGITYWWSRRYPEALQAFDRAIALAPDQLWPYLGKAFNYWSWKGVAPEGRAALAAVPLTTPWGAWAWYWQEVFEGQYAEALETLDALEGDWIRIKTGARPKALYRAWVLELSQQPQRAQEALEEARSLLETEMATDPEDPRFHSSLGVAYAMLGHKEDAIREGRKAVELFPLSKDAIYATPYLIDLAHIYALTGQNAAAIEQLDRLLLNPGWISTAYLQVDPRWNSLADDPDFQALLARHSD